MLLNLLNSYPIRPSRGCHFLGLAPKYGSNFQFSFLSSLNRDRVLDPKRHTAN